LDYTCIIAEKEKSSKREIKAMKESVVQTDWYFIEFITLSLT